MGVNSGSPVTSTRRPSHQISRSSLRLAMYSDPRQAPPDVPGSRVVSPGPPGPGARDSAVVTVGAPTGSAQPRRSGTADSSALGPGGSTRGSPRPPAASAPSRG